ncbi:hypothetical protein FRC19_004155, partial [Serendipita sp. 401]
MATLRAFQSEIEEIQAKNVAAEQQQRAAVLALETTTKKGKPAVKQDSVDNSTATAQATSPIVERDSVDEDLAGVQALLLQGDDASHRKASDLIASVVTRKRGECLVHLGLHPPHELLFANAP